MNDQPQQPPVPPQQPQQPPMPPQYPQPVAQPVQQQPVQPPYQQPMQQPGQQPIQPPMQQPMQQPQQVPPYQQPMQQPVQPQPQQQVPNTAPIKHNVHHSYVWASGIQVFIIIALVMAVTFLPIVLGEDIPVFGIPLIIGGTILFVVLIAGLTIGLQALSYKHLFYEIGEKEFTLYSGIFNKKQVHVPYQRVQSVNQRATLFQRILGVCTVNIDTAGGSSNKAVVVPYIRNSEAEYLRSELFARKQFILSGGQSAQTQTAQPGQQPSMPIQGQSQNTNVLDMPAEIISDVRGVFGGSQVYTGQVSYEYGLTNKELIFTGLSNNTGFVLMILAIISGVVGIVSQLIGTSVGEYVVNEGVSYLTHVFADRLIWFLVIAFLFGILVLWVASIIGTCITFGGFKASRRDNRIEVQQGLLQHHFHGVDIDRVQSVIIKQTFIRRLMGYCELSLGKIDAIVDSSQEQEQTMKINQGLVIHPFVKMDRVPEILAGLVPEFSDVPTEVIKLPSVSLRRAIIRRGFLYGNGFWLAIIATIILLICNSVPEVAVGLGSGLEILNLVFIGVYVICIIIAIIEIISAVLWFRGSSFAFNRHFMQVSNGGFSRESITFPRKKIQFAHIRTNPFQRRVKVATINARTAAGIGGTTMKLLDVHENDADKLLEWVKPGQGMLK